MLACWCKNYEIELISFLFILFYSKCKLVSLRILSLVVSWPQMRLRSYLVITTSTCNRLYCSVTSIKCPWIRCTVDCLGRCGLRRRRWRSSTVSPSTSPTTSTSYTSRSGLARTSISKRKFIIEVLNVSMG